LTSCQRSCPELLGYSGAASVSKDVDRALQKTAKQEQMASEQLFKLEIDRLDRIMASLWRSSPGTTCEHAGADPAGALPEAVEVDRRVHGPA
jgi:hypothetical protein